MAARAGAHWSKGWGGAALLVLDTRRRMGEGRTRQGRRGVACLGERAGGMATGPFCQRGALRIIAVLTQVEVITKIPRHLRRSPTP